MSKGRGNRQIEKGKRQKIRRGTRDGQIREIKTVKGDGENKFLKRGESRE